MEITEILCEDGQSQDNNGFFKPMKDLHEKKFKDCWKENLEEECKNDREERDDNSLAAVTTLIVISLGIECLFVHERIYLHKSLKTYDAIKD